MQDILVLGAGGFGIEVGWLIDDINRVKPSWDMLGFLDADETKWGGKRYGYNVLGDLDQLESLPRPLSMAVAIGSPQRRKSLVEMLRRRNIEFPPLIHPSVIMSKTVKISEGVIIAAGSVLTVEIHIGAHTHIDTACAVGHETKLGEYVRLNPKVSVAGNVTLSDGVYVGSGASIIQGLTIGANTVVGAGAVVIRDLPANVVAVGNPARVIKGNASLNKRNC
jgi:sugar O-acyltransferase (sialic acid O-acetyltransferase NeuD family)